LTATPIPRRIPFAEKINPENRRADWAVIGFIGAIHLGALASPWTFSWSGLVVFLILSWMGGGLGITMGFHRLLTHQSFKCPKWFYYFVTICGCLQWQGGPIRWVGTHRLHHKHSDGEEDPHTPKHGFNWAHMFWCMFKDHEDFKPYDAAKDLTKDKVMVWIDKYFVIFQFILAAGLYAGGYFYGGQGTEGHLLALSWIVWGIFLRTACAYHGTWLVNSATHTWGYRNFKTTDDSRNSWWVALLSFGEGWHNNHHAFQRSAAHGLKWWEFDITYITIRLLGLVGIAKDIVKPTTAQMEQKNIPA
tara:strand:+ start:15240 stop:16151 length:912 start_codon:yes stop_codon:yes gene_type:complete